MNFMKNKFYLCVFTFLFSCVFCPKAEAVKFYWTIQTAEGGVFQVGRATSLALDSSNKAHISYTGGNVKYATNASGSWVIQTVTGESPSDSTSIALDSSNKAHIIYQDQDAGLLRYATNASGSWVIQSVASSSGRDVSLALDSSNKAYISYYTGSPALDLGYATNASGSWVLQTVASTGEVGQYSSLALDSSNKAYISYYDATNRDLRYATNASGSWVNEDLTTANEGEYTSLALDSSNKAYISYYHNTLSDLKYATNASGSWVTQFADVDAGTAVGQYTSIALDSSNKAYISYYNAATNFDLKFATNVSGSWVTQIVDSTGDVGQFTSLAIDSSRNAYISYLDATNTALKYVFGEAGNTSTDRDGVLINLTDESGALPGYTITYDDITADGRTRVLARTTPTSGANSFLSDPEVGLMLNNTVRNLSVEDTTFATAGGLGFLYRIPYQDADVAAAGVSESLLRAFKYIGPEDVLDVTATQAVLTRFGIVGGPVDTTNNWVYAFAQSNSDFGVGVNPEPATLILLGSGLLGLLPFRKRFLK